MNIMILAATHGDETLGIQFYQYLLESRSALLENIDFVLANPKAYNSNVRYVDTDLNRSYVALSNGYEKNRAEYIKKRVKETSPDIVLDMHTTRCVQPPCLVVNNIKGRLKKQFLRASNIDKLLIVDTLADSTSLQTNVVGYEVMEQQITRKLLAGIESDIERFILDVSVSSAKQGYIVTGKLYKSDVSSHAAESLINFEPHKLGFTPVLVGDNSYSKNTNYIGFKTVGPSKIEV